jgi:hypothetical protein
MRPPNLLQDKQSKNIEIYFLYKNKVNTIYVKLREYFIIIFFNFDITKISYRTIPIFNDKARRNQAKDRYTPCLS